MVALSASNSRIGLWSIKFTEHGQVELAVRFFEDRQPPAIEFDIVDTGIGMTEQQLSRLFQPFTHADENSRRYPPIGLARNVLGIYR